MDFLSSLFESIIESFFAFPILAYKRGGVLCVLAFVGFILKLAFPYVLRLDTKKQQDLLFLWFSAGALITNNKELAIIYCFFILFSSLKKSNNDDTDKSEEKEL